LARLKIPEIGVDYIVVAGVSTKDLRDGPGHFPNTPLPGQYGNSAIAGHRTTYGAPFYDLDHLKPGDEIQVFTKLGGAYVYIVTGSEVVSPTDYHVITDSDPTKATITLVTCTPLRTAKERLVVHGTLDQSRSNEIGKPLINYGQSTPIPTDSVLPGDDTEASTAVSAAAAPAVTTEPVATTVDTAPVTATTQPDNRFATTDAFSQGWFGDRAAWPHVVFWCALLALVWYGSYRLAKRFRRLWLGLAVGFVPFVIVLYFFYENVNRLLPPAL
jgi:sortase A